MAGETTITVVGNLTADPELRFSPSGHAVANFTIASTPRNFDKASGEWKDGQPLFLRCSLWREAAENVAETLTKGMRVIAQGRLSVRQYETKDGRQGTSVELDVEEIGPSLRFATAQVTRTRQNTNYGGGFGGSNAGAGGQDWQSGAAPTASQGAAGSQQQEQPSAWSTPALDEEPPF